jgi:hypothetical protein
MTTHLPIACTLSAGELSTRLDEIRAVGRDALRTKREDGARAVLLFDRKPGVLDRVAAIVAAESRCCAFLTFELAETADAIRLAIEAPEDAAPVLAELVDAFEPAPAT